LTDDFGDWLSTSSRFFAFAQAHRDKIRKKLRVSTEAGARGDIRAELETAFLLLADRRIALAFEAYGSGRRGPDFTVTFRASHRFNLEVTRPRPRDGDPAAAIAFAVLGKLRQLPVESPNALLLASGIATSPDELVNTMRALKLRADRGDEAYFTNRGLSTSEFQQSYRRLAALLAGNASGPGVHAWSNPEARRPLPEGALSACVAALAFAPWSANRSASPAESGAAQEDVGVGG
jgi:hypothetical protein